MTSFAIYAAGSASVTRYVRVPTREEAEAQLAPGETLDAVRGIPCPPLDAPAPLTLAEAEQMILGQIDAQAGVARQRWLTIVPGQSDAYREKMADVASISGLGGTTALILAALKALPATEQQARWPFLYAEMQASGAATLVQARDAVTAAAAASRAARAEIERRRRAAKIAVRAAKTLAAKQAAAIVDWKI
ncbi:hypothetical protein [Sphingomonas sp. BK235]|uniref:hypothetical protein n=1 Tax=Sphingomonas sp. BK235 TaxID=2512131 RepID=UPI001042C1EA|nr:hypothetical protein [Sphingomonas sp. BK235]TCP33281.1 hypothetical protein EV292_106223 [Sphingomonas sp. BK235]